MNRKERRAAKKTGSNGHGRPAAGAAGDGVSGLYRQAVQLHQAGALAEAERGYRQVLKLAPRHADSLHYLGVIALQRGDNEAAIDLIGRAIAENAAVPDFHYHCGIALVALGRLEPSIAAYREALRLKPDYARARINLAVALIAARRWPEAAAECRRVLEQDPNSAEAHNNLGLALGAQGSVIEATVAFKRALELKPDLIEALNNQGKLLLETGSPDGALPALSRALKVRETEETKRLIAACLTSGRPLPATESTRALLLRAFSESWVWPDELAGIAASFIKTGSAREYLKGANAAWPALLSAHELLGSSGLAEIAIDELLRCHLETTRNHDVELERFLTATRAAILELAAAGAPELEREHILRLVAALARQCFINEYVFACGDDERKRAEALRDRLADALKAGGETPAAWIAVVGAYFPLQAIAGAENLLAKSWPNAIAALLAQQVREPKEELALQAAIPRLTAIKDEVSLRVQEQYEQNPYPRWVRLGAPARPRTFNRILGEAFPLSGFVPLPKEAGVEVLIAGCGTGQQPIERMRESAGARMLAIDLSLASLAYASRKTKELGISGIEYAQADILELGTLGRSFDVIESGGVLVAIADPFTAWRKLAMLLAPGGLMYIGLYSERARRNIVAAQKYLAAQGFRATPEDMRRGRQAIMALADGSRAKSVTAAGDFFTMSTCRDLLFHVQETRFTLPEIAGFLKENGLKFLGFVLPEPVQKRYSERFPDDPARTNLEHWDQFERENPDSFISMYQFWVQKAA